MRHRRLRHARGIGLGAATVLASAAVAAWGASGSGVASADASTHSSTGATVSVVGFSVLQPAYDALEKAFRGTSAGRGVGFSQSFGASGSQSEAVANGQPADYVAFSLAPDMQKLVPKFVASTWDRGASKGIGSSSVVVIAVRPGNPLHITGWQDLLRPRVKIVTPDPATSGSAKWNILAAYSYKLQTGGNAAQAKRYLTGFFKHVVSKPDSGADATTEFLQGTGNVLITYENEAIAARQAGEKLSYIVPKQTLKIQNPVAVTRAAPPVARRFLQFVESPSGQRVLAAEGFRPSRANEVPARVRGATDPRRPYPKVTDLETVAALGGWSKLNARFFGPDGIVSKIEQATG